jgi:hypothetical protein
MSLLKDDDDFSIDRFQLELEAERNSQLIRKYGKKLAFAVAQVKDERRKLDFIETECAEVIRSNKRAYGIDKATDKVVFGLVKGEKEYIDQFNRYLMALRKEKDYESAVQTCQQRGMMIRVLTEQWLNNYYSKPVVYDSSIKRNKLNSKREQDF